MKTTAVFTTTKEWEKAFFPNWVVRAEGSRLLQDPHAFAENSIAELTQSMVAKQSTNPLRRRITQSRTSSKP